MSRQNHKLEQQIQNLHINNKVIVVVAAPPTVTKIQNAAIRKSPANYNKNNSKSGEGNGSSNSQKPLGHAQNSNNNKNKTYNHGTQQNAPKNTFHQQQFTAPKQHGLKTAQPQKQHNIKTTQPQKQQNYTNITASNKTNVQFGSNAKPNCQQKPKKNYNNQGTGKTNASTNKVTPRNHTSNNSKIVINVMQTNVVINK